MRATPRMRAATIRVWAAWRMAASTASGSWAGSSRGACSMPAADPLRYFSA